jgi:hypothetical protein
MRRDVVNWTVPVVLAACAAVGVATVAMVDDDSTQSSIAQSRSLIADIGPDPSAGTSLGRLEQSLKVTKGSVEKVASFGLSSGRTVRIHLATTDDGKSCLIDESSEIGAGATCVEGGLFDERPVVFSVDSQGGPERFRELYIPGVAAPGIATVVVAKTDGSSVKLRVAGTGAFLFRSTPGELARDVLPADVRLYSADATLVETVTIPALR